MCVNYRPEDGPKKGKRDPKLFFVLTTSSTSTLSTSTHCYITGAGNAGTSSGTCKKKKKSIVLAGYGKIKHAIRIRKLHFMLIYFRLVSK